MDSCRITQLLIENASKFDANQLCCVKPLNDLAATSSSLVEACNILEKDGNPLESKHPLFTLIVSEIILSDPFNRHENHCHSVPHEGPDKDKLTCKCKGPDKDKPTCAAIRAVMGENYMLATETIEVMDSDNDSSDEDEDEDEVVITNDDDELTQFNLYDMDHRERFSHEKDEETDEEEEEDYGIIIDAQTEIKVTNQWGGEFFNLLKGEVCVRTELIKKALEYLTVSHMDSTGQEKPCSNITLLRNLVDSTTYFNIYTQWWLQPLDVSNCVTAEGLWKKLNRTMKAGSDQAANLNLQALILLTEKGDFLKLPAPALPVKNDIGCINIALDKNTLKTRGKCLRLFLQLVLPNVKINQLIVAKNSEHSTNNIQILFCDQNNMFLTLVGPSNNHIMSTDCMVINECKLTGEAIKRALSNTLSNQPNVGPFHNVEMICSMFKEFTRKVFKSFPSKTDFIIFGSVCPCVVAHMHRNTPHHI